MTDLPLARASSTAPDPRNALGKSSLVDSAHIRSRSEQVGTNHKAHLGWITSSRFDSRKQHGQQAYGSASASTSSVSSPEFPPTSTGTPQLLSPHSQAKVRYRVASGGHGRSLRCSPDCSAAEPPYRLLASAIGRASVTNTRGAEHSTFTPPARFDLQSRRSKRRLESPMLCDTPPLAFDPKLLQQSPALPTADKSPAFPMQEFFADFRPEATETESVFHALPESISMPAIAYAPQALSSAPAGMTPEYPRDLNNRMNPHLRSASVSPLGEGLAVGRYATTQGRKRDVTPVVRSGGVPLDFAGYLGPELAATLHQRLEQAETRDRSVKEQPPTEAEWSFILPTTAAMTDIVQALAASMRTDSLIRIAEYGCHRDTPNPMISEFIRATSQKGKTLSLNRQCPRDFDIRPLRSAVEATKRKSQSQTLLTSYTFSRFEDVVFPPQSVDAAFAGGEISRLHGSQQTRPLYGIGSRVEDREMVAQNNLTDWLEARSVEIRPGGTLIFHFAIRTFLSPDQSTTETSPGLTASMSLPSSPRSSLDGSPLAKLVAGPPLPSPPTTNGQPHHFRMDIWQAMYRALSPAVQRLVSLDEIRSSVAPMLVDVPYWPRTLANVRAVLTHLSKWEIVKDTDPPAHTSEYFSAEERTEWAEQGVRIHRLLHPAWLAFERGDISRGAYAKRVAIYCRSVYEYHLKRVLREKGRMDIGQSETTVQELFKILVEKCELGALDALELDTGIVVLRRK